METSAYFRKDFELMNEIKLDFLNINVLGYYQGSQLWEDAFKKGLIKKNETMVFANKKLSKFSHQQLKKIRDDYWKEFYADPRRLIRIVYKFWCWGELWLLIRGIFQLWPSLKDAGQKLYKDRNKKEKILAPEQ